MTPLTQTAYFTRIGIKLSIIGLFVMIIGRVVLEASVAWWKAANPPPPPPPTMGFGILPELNFPEEGAPELSYKLETPTGQVPSFSDRMPVYLMPVERPNLLALEKAKTQAANLGFKAEPVKVSDTLYRWSKDVPLPSQLRVFIYNGAFNMSVDWSYDPSFLLQNTLPSEPDAIAAAGSYLTNAAMAPADLMEGASSIRYLKATGRDFVETISLSEADFLEVNLFRTDIDDKFPVVTPDPDKGIVQAVFSGNNAAKVVSLEYNYFPVDYDTFETYPIKSSEQAWNELLQNQGYIANYDTRINAVTVRRVELGYYDNYSPQKYLQPVFIFKGDNDFVAYVPAVIIPNLNETSAK